MAKKNYFHLSGTIFFLLVVLDLAFQFALCDHGGFVPFVNTLAWMSHSLGHGTVFLAHVVTGANGLVVFHRIYLW